MTCEKKNKREVSYHNERKFFVNNQILNIWCSHKWICSGALIGHLGFYLL